MNERIKQLAEQCESFGSWDNKTYSFDKERLLPSPEHLTH